jgi:hypothetical protein
VREARAKPGEAALPSLDAVREEVAGLVTDKLRVFLAEARDKQARESATLREHVDALRDTHARERELLRSKQAGRWAQETQERSGRLRAGLRGLWDNITGRARAIRTVNEEEAIQGLLRDRAQRDRLIASQLKERQPLQDRLDDLRKRHAQERRLLAQDVVQHLRRKARDRKDRAPPPPRPRKRGHSLQH